MRRSAKPWPLYFTGGTGAVINDVDGNSYIDYAMGWGPLILGHAPEVVSTAGIDANSGVATIQEACTVSDIVISDDRRTLSFTRLDAGLPFPAGGSAADLAAPIGVMEAEHAGAGAALARMRHLTGGYAPPEWACPTFRGLYFGLSQLEADMHLHVHLENNILFPRAAWLASHGRA